MIGRQASFVVWAILGGTVVMIQVAAVASRGRFAGVGESVRRLTASGLGGGVFVLAWMWLGWHAFAR
ncbi:MAG TPA: hypothetical protein VHW93_03955 [Acidimicrobiales bacterium]|jgi:hypothetical protein|nr:hypothetical protein [Acidimicrobiales bacterium]